MHRSLTASIAAVVTTAVVVGSLSFDHDATTVDATPVAFLETVDGAPATPTAWTSPNWDISVHSRNADTWQHLETMHAMHGPDCGAPPATHQTNSYEDSVFQCRNHLMTALKAEGYGVTYLTPNHLVDFSNGEAVISFDISTLRTSRRDFWDVWITPYEDHLQLPLETSFPDLQGPPRNSIKFTLTSENTISGQIFRNFEPVLFPSWPNDTITHNWWQGYQTIFTPDAARRDKVEIRLSRTRIKVGFPAYNFWYIDTEIPALDFTTGVVQFGHHSYNPEKDCGVANTPGPDGQCRANTWHWDNFSISPARPFSIVKSTRRSADAMSPGIEFAAPAPANAKLRFVAIGTNIQVRFDNGGWQPAVKQAQVRADEGHFTNYWMDVPAGTTRVEFSGGGWWGGSWAVRDASFWTRDAVAAPPPDPTTTTAPTATAPATVPTTAAPTTTATTIPTTVPTTTVATIPTTVPTTTVPTTTVPTTIPATTVPATVPPPPSTTPPTSAAPTTTIAVAPTTTIVTEGAVPKIRRGWRPRPRRSTTTFSATGSAAATAASGSGLGVRTPESTSSNAAGRVTIDRSFMPNALVCLIRR
jgi:hypothetical protein